jgi:hypothetical protein
LLYTNHHVHTEYFPFGPARAWVSLPPWFDRSVTFRAVHSLPLTPEVRRAKLLALDMHHDLRPAPSPVERGPLPTFLGRLGGMVRALIRDPARELSYFRRAPRPNELFFVYAAADRALLEQWAANALAKP